jgi:hypothetical protein
MVAAPTLAPMALMIAAGVSAANWYLQPERTAAWAATTVFLAIAMAVFLIVRARGGDERGQARFQSVAQAIVFAGLIACVTLSARLALTLGLVDDVDRSRRATMAIVGAFFIFLGNAMPKTLTPLSALRCDPAQAQAFQRFAGWLWVLTGVAFAAVWLAAPIAVARPLSLLVLAAAMLALLTRILRLFRWRQREA